MPERRADLRERVRFVPAGDGQRLALTELGLRGSRSAGPAFLLLHGFAQPGATHVDAIAGRHVRDTVARLWSFLLRESPE